MQHVVSVGGCNDVYRHQCTHVYFFNERLAVFMNEALRSIVLDHPRRSKLPAHQQHVGTSRYVVQSDSRDVPTPSIGRRAVDITTVNHAVLTEPYTGSGQHNMHMGGNITIHATLNNIGLHSKICQTWTDIRWTKDHLLK